MLKLFSSILASLTTLRNSEGVKYEKKISIAFLPHVINLLKWAGVAPQIFMTSFVLAV